MPRPPLSAVSGRQRVLDAAAKLFRSDGYHATTLRQIARECGLQAGSIYYHFGSKDEILAEVLDVGVQRVFDAVRSAVEALPSEATSYEKVSAAINAHLESFFVHGDYTTTHIRVFGQAPGPIQVRNRKLRDRYEQFWSGLLNEARTRGEVRQDVDLSVARLFLLGGLNWTIEWYRDRKLSFRELAKTYVEVLFHGLASSER